MNNAANIAGDAAKCAMHILIQLLFLLDGDVNLLGEIADFLVFLGIHVCPGMKQCVDVPLIAFLLILKNSFYIGQDIRFRKMQMP